MHFNKRLLSLVAAAMCILVLTTGCGQGSSGVVATVNGEKITGSQLDKRVAARQSAAEKMGYKFDTKEGKDLLAQIRSSELEGLIEETLVKQQAVKEKLWVSEDAAKKQLDAIKQSMGSEDDYKKALAQANLTEAEALQQVQYKMSYDKIFDQVTKGVPAPSEADAQKYYDQHKDQFSQPEQYQVRHILFAVNNGQNTGLPKRTDAEAKAAAQQTLAEITLQNKDFATEAKEKSDDTGTKNDGGLFTFNKDDQSVDPAFLKAAESLQPGQVTPQPVKSQFGYHIIKLEKIIPAQQKSFAEVKQDIINQLTQQSKQDKFNQYIDQLKKNAKIVNDLAPKSGDSSKKQ